MHNDYCQTSINSLDDLRGKKVTVFLSAGGNRAAFQWGVWKQLRSAGVEAAKIWGVSGGSLASLLISLEDMNRADDIIFNISDGDIYTGNPILRIATLRSSLYTMRPLENLIREKIPTLDDLKIPVSTVSVSLNEQHTKVFSTETDDYDTFVKGVRASSSIPALFDPVEIEGTYYVDGGVKTWTPLKYALEDDFDSDVIIVISTQPRSQPNEFVDFRPFWWNVLTRTLPVMTNRIFNADFEKFEIINRAVDQLKALDRDAEFRNASGRAYTKFDYLYIEPDEVLDTALDFTRPAMLKAFTAGTRVGTNVINILKP